MGCDIHLYTEIWEGDKWINADYWKVNSYYDPAAVVGPDGYYEKEYSVVPIYDDRNYDLFTVLANVRNYGKSHYIDAPRGIPDDVSSHTNAEYEGWGVDVHSASYFTLAELRNYMNHHSGVKQSGLISRDAAKELDENGVLPDTWCQGSSDKTLVRRTWTAFGSPLEKLVDLLEGRVRKLMYIWDKEQNIEGEEKKFRIVFWFDN